jgi:hypothetical protein
MLSEFAIDPSAIAVPVGQPIEFSVMNMGQAQHTFAVDVDGTTYETDMIDPNATVVLDVPALKPGPTRRTAPSPDTRTWACSRPSRRDGRRRRGRHRIELRRPRIGGDERGDDGVDAQGRGVDAFLAGNQTDTQGNQPLEPTMDGTTKVFSLTRPT